MWIEKEKKYQSLSIRVALERIAIKLLQNFISSLYFILSTCPSQLLYADQADSIAHLHC